MRRRARARQPTVLLRRHAGVFAESAVKAAAGAEPRRERDIEDRSVGIAQQRPDMVDAHGGNVLLQETMPALRTSNNARCACVWMPYSGSRAVTCVEVKPVNPVFYKADR